MIDPPVCTSAFLVSFKHPFSMERIHSFKNPISGMNEGVVAPWCNPLTLKPEQSGGVGSIPGRTPPLERHDKGSWA